VGYRGSGQRIQIALAYRSSAKSTLLARPRTLRSVSAARLRRVRLGIAAGAAGALIPKRRAGHFTCRPAGGHRRALLHEHEFRNHPPRQPTIARAGAGFATGLPAGRLLLMVLACLRNWPGTSAFESPEIVMEEGHGIAPPGPPDFAARSATCRTSEKLTRASQETPAWTTAGSLTAESPTRRGRRSHDRMAHLARGTATGIAALEFLCCPFWKRL
jgi:hypothetical protein